MPNAATATKTQRRGRPPSRRPAQHSALLDAAVEQINLNGAASISLAQLGERIGVTRSGIYYYCADAADLVFQCYVRSCARLQEDIDSAASGPGDADDRLAALIRRVLAPDRPPIAVLNDIAFLPEPLQADITARAAKHKRGISVMLNDGRKAGVLRAVDVELAARLILNCLSWALVSQPWLARRNDPRGRRQYADVVAGIILDGVATGPERVLGCDVRFDALTARSINAFDRRQTADLKSDQIIAAASRLFNALGLDGVRLDDVSAAIGASKGAIYHHFRDKTELVERCYERGFEIYDLIMDTGVKTGKTPVEQFAIVQHLNTQAQLNPAPPLALQPGLSALAPAKRRTLTRRAQSLNAVARQIISKGIRAGHCQALDAELVPQVLAGYFTGLAQWIPPDADPVAIADDATNFAAYGLRARR